MQATIYSAPNCGYCTLMKQFLDEQQIDYNVVMIDEPEIAQYLMNETGRLGAPQTIIEGYWVLGYDPNTAMKILNKKAASSS
jgi:glutaredoxin 3